MGAWRMGDMDIKFITTSQAEFCSTYFKVSLLLYLTLTIQVTQPSLHLPVHGSRKSCQSGTYLLTLQVFLVMNQRTKTCLTRSVQIKISVLFSCSLANNPQPQESLYFNLSSTSGFLKMKESVTGI